MSYGNRVKETSTTTGTGNITTAGAVAGFVTFNTAFSTNHPFHYFILHDSDNTWETGIGHLTAATTFVRNVILDNSSGGTTAIDFASGGLTLIASPSAGSLTNNPAYAFNGAGASQFLVNEWDEFSNAVAYTMTADRVVGSPFKTSVGLVCTAMRMNVSTGALTTKIKFALYLLDQSGNARTRLVSCRTNVIDSATSGGKTADFDEGATYIPPGNYLGTFVSDGAPAITAQDASDPSFRSHFLSSGTDATIQRGLFADSHTYATALPEPLAVTWSAASSIDMPRFVLEP